VEIRGKNNLKGETSMSYSCVEPCLPTPKIYFSLGHDPPREGEGVPIIILVDDFIK